MLSYRHAFHAGNHADMLKHFVLYLTLDYFNRKDKPYWYIDTHSGAGLYDLRGNEAQKVGEYKQGIALLQQAAKLPPGLHDFLGRLNAILPEPHLYCGSPWLAQAMLQYQLDKLPIDYIEKRSAIVDAVTLDDVKRVSKRLWGNGRLTVIVGRNALQNERVTWKLGQPEDLWLHARRVPGSHVIIKTNGQEVPQ